MKKKLIIIISAILLVLLLIIVLFIVLNSENHSKVNYWFSEHTEDVIIGSDNSDEVGYYHYFTLNVDDTITIDIIFNDPNYDSLIFYFNDEEITTSREFSHIYKDLYVKKGDKITIHLIPSNNESLVEKPLFYMFAINYFLLTDLSQVTSK